VWALGVLPARAAALDIPQLRGRVNDYASLLDSSQEKQLEDRLAAFEAKTGHQFALLTVPSLQGTPIEEFGIKVGEAWRLGNKERDDGLVLIVASQDRKMRIEVGYGLEGEIPDAVASRVIREVLQPAFRRGDYASGIRDGFSVLIAAAGGEGQVLPQRAPAQRDDDMPLGIKIFLAVLAIFASMLFGSGGVRWRVRGPFYRSGSFGSSGGWGGGGGGGGGGFSGGGGGFGGGGASGDW
jgi:uncharacterized protein